MLDKPKRALVVAGAAAALGAAGAAIAGAGEHAGGAAAAGSRARPAASAVSAAPTAPTGPPCGTFTGRGCAPESSRVDLAAPSFSHPTEITNPLFPISRLQSVVLLGHVGRKPFRTETTLLPGTKTVVVDGQKVEVLVSQYVAYLDGRLDQVALDRYAQADDGSVWYLGEDVFLYRHGVVDSTEGTWLAGREGPPAMIMPAHPKVGDTFRTENAPGVVFEEVTVKRAGTTVHGPLGAVRGALVISELHTDQAHEDKSLAPGYGEFRTAGGGELEALALAVPADALPGREPAALQTLATTTEGVLESARLSDWEAASSTLARIGDAWASVRSVRQPSTIAARLTHALKALRGAVRTHRSLPATQAAIDLAQSVLDLRLRHRPVTEVDAARFHLWTQQLRVHAAAKDLAAVTGDVATLEWIHDRIADGLAPAARQEIDSRLRDLRAAADARNLRAAADHAARLGARLRNVVTSPPSG